MGDPKEIDAKDLFKSKTGEGSESGPSPDIQTPTEAEMREAASPELSQDEFEIGGRTFKYRISNIRTQKMMALALDSITDLLKKIDLAPIFKSIQERIDKPRKKMLERISAAKNAHDGPLPQEEIDKIVQEVTANSEDNFLDLIEVIQDILKHGGLSNILGAIMNLYAGIVYAICYCQDKSVTKEWIEENLTMFDAQEIFFEQMQKDRIGGKVIDFLYLLTRQVISP